MRNYIWLRLRAKKKDHGCSLNEDILVPDVQLFKGDRLEPSEHLLDVMSFNTMPLPNLVNFWRCNNNDRLLHECPLFLVRGLTISAVAVDLLHTWALGSVSYFVGFVLRFMMNNRVWIRDIPYIMADDVLELNLLQLKSELWQYYLERRQNDPTWTKKGSEVQRIVREFIICSHLFLPFFSFILASFSSSSACSPSSFSALTKCSRSGMEHHYQDAWEAP